MGHITKYLHIINRVPTGVPNNVLIAFGLLSIIVLCLIVILLVQRRVIRNQTRLIRVVNNFLQKFNPRDSLESNLQEITGLITQVVKAPYYAFYALEPRSSRYVLKTVSHPYDKMDAVSPSYSGLSLPKRDPYIPPRTIDLADNHEDPVAFRTEGEVSLLEVRTPGSLAVLRIGPMDSVPRRTLRQLRRVLATLGSTIDEMVQLAEDKQRFETSQVADTAVQKVASIGVDASAAINAIVQVFAGAHASGAILVPFKVSEEIEVFGSTELREVANRLDEDTNSLKSLYTALGTRQMRIIARSENLFEELPPCITSMDCGGVALMSIEQRGLLTLIFSSGFDVEESMETRATQLGLLADQLSDISIFNELQPVLSRSYAKMLWKMADMLDNLSPYNVGYSEMMTRYSLAIASRLRLSDAEMRDLALAAHVSNIGVLGVDPDLLTKQGKYSKFESDTMQMHCEIGATMIRLATGNHRAADMVLYHHERVDGMGFPAGIRDTDIPIGAKILHVVQVFLAKINGRSWRDPLPFEKALDTLRAATSTQLDVEVVEAFVEWFRSKQSDPLVEGKSLGRCYEMCCTPKSICQSCPVYVQPEANCWEVPNNQCAAHGRECDTCFVKTEYMHRHRLVTV